MPTRRKASSGVVDFATLKVALNSAKNYEELKKIIVEEPFKQPVAIAYLFLAFIVLIMVNEETNLIDRVAITDTELARNTFEVTAVPFEDIKIPLHHPENILAKAIDDGQPHDTTDWYYTFTPAMTGEQARINQASAGIAYTAVYPLKSKPGGVLSFSYYQYASEIGDLQREFMKDYTKIVSTALDRTLTK